MKNKPRVLIVAPKISIFDSWLNDAAKFNIDIEDAEFTTYLSLNKKNTGDFDIVILDECHSLLTSHHLFLGQFNGKVLGLTGTPPRHQQSEKGKMVSQYCPIKYKYITDDAVSDDILNDYRIIVHRMPLSTSNTIINNKEDEKKQKNLEARRRAARAFYERNKDNEVYKQKQRDNSKRVYQNDKERIIARVRANQRRQQDIEQLERLHELKQQGLITFEKLNLKDSHELLNNLEILGM